MPAPEGFRVPDTGAGTVTPGVLKAVSGSMKALPVRIFIDHEYDDKASKNAGIEIKREHVMIGIKTDRYSEVAIAERDLDMEKRFELQPLIDRFYTQKDSQETAIETWDVIGPQERNFLAKMGINSVEQLAATPDALVSRLGVFGPGLKQKAERHLAGKVKDAERQEVQEEMRMLREENAKLAERMKEIEAIGFQAHAAKAKEKTREKAA